MDFHSPRLVVRDGLIPETIIDQALESVPEESQWNWSDSFAFFPLLDTHPVIHYLAGAVSNTVSRIYHNPEPDFSESGLYLMKEGQAQRPIRVSNLVPRVRRLRRRVGVIIFLNDPDGGDFQLWDESGPTNFVPPLRGRLIFFDIDAYHGVTRVGEGSRRLTLEMYVASLVTAEDTPAHQRATLLEDDHPETFQP